MYVTVEELVPVIHTGLLEINKNINIKRNGKVAQISNLEEMTSIDTKVYSIPVTIKGILLRWFYFSLIW